MRFETVTPLEFLKRCRHLFDQTYAEAAILGQDFDLSEEADAVENAVEKTLAQGARTADLKEEGLPVLSTTAMTEQVIKNI